MRGHGAGRPEGNLVIVRSTNELREMVNIDREIRGMIGVCPIALKRQFILNVDELRKMSTIA
ncbi:MAG: hypothetical protein ACI8T1_004812 [Verrucomicrobiales bacterium]